MLPAMENERMLFDRKSAAATIGISIRGLDYLISTGKLRVRRLGKRVVVNAEGDLPARAVADLFPAYDDDGGLLLILTPSK